MNSSSPLLHSPYFKLPTSSCKISTSLPNSDPTFGSVLPKSPCTNYLMYVPALAQTSRIAECPLTRWAFSLWINFYLLIRVRLWSTRKGVSCCRAKSFADYSVSLSYSVRGCSEYM